MSFDYNAYRRNFSSRLVPHLVCADGFTMSVQAGQYLYSTPRTEALFYNEVEVGYPSKREKSLMPYAESPYYPTDTVYGYVPVEIVNAIVDTHGGLAPDDFVSTVKTCLKKAGAYLRG